MSSKYPEKLLAETRKKLETLKAQDHAEQVAYGRLIANSRKSERERVRLAAEAIIAGNEPETEDVDSEAVSAELRKINRRRRVLAEAMAALQGILTGRELELAYEANQPVFDEAIESLAQLAIAIEKARHAQREATKACNAALEADRRAMSLRDAVPGSPVPPYGVWRLTPAVTFAGDLLGDPHNKSKVDRFMDDLRAAEIEIPGDVRPFEPQPMTDDPRLKRAKPGEADSSGRPARIAADFVSRS
jgi:hypothetical protein